MLLLSIFLVLPSLGLAQYPMGPSVGSGETLETTKSIEKRVTGSTNDGRGGNAAPVERGQNVTYSIAITGAPPGQSGKKGEVIDNVPQHMEFVSASPEAQFDGNKAT